MRFGLVSQASAPSWDGPFDWGTVNLCATHFVTLFEVGCMSNKQSNGTSLEIGFVGPTRLHNPILIRTRACILRCTCVLRCDALFSQSSIRTWHELAALPRAHRFRLLWTWHCLRAQVPNLQGLSYRGR